MLEQSQRISMKENTLFVFTNSRKIRSFNAAFENGLIAKSITIAEFEKKAVFVADRFEADAAYLLVLMQRACTAVKEANSVLKIPNEFFAFLKNNDYLFSFFKELAISKKSVADIKFSDIYADFEEHLSILQAVLSEYKRLLEAENLYDDILLPEIYSLNESYVRGFDEIVIDIDGFLSEFEWKLILKISKLVTLKIRFQTSKFNQKLVEKISQISGLAPQNFSLYQKFELNFNDMSLTQTDWVNRQNVVQVREFGLRSLQCAYVMAKVSEFVKDGLKPENIVVILPDESFSEILRLHDSGRMFNYAMGENLKRTKFFQILSRITRTINEEISPDFDYENAQSYDEEGFILGLLGVKKELFERFKAAYELPCEFEMFEGLVNEILALQEDKRVGKKVQNELFMLGNLARYFKFSLRQICEIFLMGLSRLSLDDVGGGKVGVMGVLESRGMRFDGAIIVDFNDELIPKRSINEMFLNSRVREKAGLISYAQRENLQRFYYESLINGAKKVAISYVSNDESIASRFLKEFSFVKDARFSDEAYANLLGKPGVALNLEPEEIVLEHDFFAQELSFSTLNLYLSCPRKYYYAKILAIPEPKTIGTAPASRLGEAVHKALCEYYQGEFFRRSQRFDVTEFKKCLGKFALSSLEFEILTVKFDIYAQYENERLKEGVRVLECEKNVSGVEFEGVKIRGVIDRVDELSGQKMIIDYKSGKFEDKSLQLPFYQALLGERCETFYYDLGGEMTLVPSRSSLEELRAAIEGLKSINKTRINFAPNPGQQCRYCSYKILCKGEL